MSTPLNLSSNDSQTISHRRVWALALPIMLSNVSEPLLGLVDTMVIGQLGEEGLIGAISIGAIIFSFLFWAFGFLRLSTAGFVAQANGARDHVEISAVLVRAMAIALVIGLLILVCQSWSRTLAFWWFSLQPSLEQQATTYYDIRIWSAPAAMVTYVVLGWLVGMQKTVYVMILQLTLNGINIILDIIFVSWFGWAVEGVAYATLIAQWVTLVLSLVLAYRLMPKVQLTRAFIAQSRQVRCAAESKHQHHVAHTLLDFCLCGFQSAK